MVLRAIPKSNHFNIDGFPLSSVIQSMGWARQEMQSMCLTLCHMHCGPHCIVLRFNVWRETSCMHPILMQPCLHQNCCISAYSAFVFTPSCIVHCAVFFTPPCVQQCTTLQASVPPSKQQCATTLQATSVARCIHSQL